MSKEKKSPYLVERYRIRLDHDVMVEEGDEENAPLYVRLEPPMVVDMHVDSMACVPRGVIFETLFNRLKGRLV